MPERCKNCGFRVRSKGHDQGPNHKGQTAKARGQTVRLGPRNIERPKTPKKDKHPGFDFAAIKIGGRPGGGR